LSVDHLSFDFGDPWLEVGGLRLALQAVTFENLYGLDPSAATRSREGDVMRLTAGRLAWAGGQERVDGSGELIAEPGADGRLVVRAEVTAPSTIRASRVLVRGITASDVLGTGWREGPIGEGRVFEYPSGSRNERIHTPLLFLRDGDRYHWFRSLDDQVRRKAFAVYPTHGEPGLTVELIHEDLGPEMRSTTRAPAWEIGETDDPDRIVAEQMEHLERSFGLVPWEDNPRVPAWLRDVALVAYLHGQHWTGYVFNGYDAMLHIIRELAGRFEGRRILAHLAGWEGRYYWQYGDFRPDARMGGEAAFRRLCDGAHELGVRLQLMLGGNCVNTATPGFERWGEPSFLRTAGGAIEWGNRPDWDMSRSHDTPWQAWLNPGAPGWHERLLEQAGALIEQYGIDSIFLDTYGVWTNAPDHAVYPGLLGWRDDLAERHPGVFLTGEQWWDALSAVSPLTHDDALYLARWPEFFGRYNRGYAFNGWGDPSRDSTGVFEGGWQPFRRVPRERHLIPTLVVVDGTLERAPDAVEAVLDDARWYRDTHLTGMTRRSEG
jgi:hypothetical protein